ncbi:MAG: hypothetical protein QXQ31_06880 [Zestosphaera sp.]
MTHYAHAKNGEEQYRSQHAKETDPSLISELNLASFRNDLNVLVQHVVKEEDDWLVAQGSNKKRLKESKRRFGERLLAPASTIPTVVLQSIALRPTACRSVNFAEHVCGRTFQRSRNACGWR